MGSQVSLMADESSWFVSRELSWLQFNRRVLQEAWDVRQPLLQRCMFLSIVESNLDEFFMIRLSGLHKQVLQGYSETDPSGLTPRDQLERCLADAHAIANEQNDLWANTLRPALAELGIYFMSLEDLQGELKPELDAYFDRHLLPILTPIAIDSGRPEPFIHNLLPHFVVELENDSQSDLLAIVPLPLGKERLLELPSQDGKVRLVFKEDIIRLNLQSLFNGYRIRAIHMFRVTRDNDIEYDEEEAQDLMEVIDSQLQGRLTGLPVRMEVTRDMTPHIRERLAQLYTIPSEAIFENPERVDYRFAAEVTKLAGFENHKSSLPSPVKLAIFNRHESIFDAIKERDILLHHPFDNFGSVIDFIESAERDPDVLAIKMTLYRVSGNSPIVESLKRAAVNGKQVTVLFELKARFDEKANIHWSQELESVGAHVIYGLPNLKVHSKICMVIRREADGIRRYCHFATGNYHDGTARLYTDIGMLTCRPEAGRDGSSLFNFLTGYSLPPRWEWLIPAPAGMRDALYMLIDQEIENARSGADSGIIAKMNSLVDPGIIKRLYEASQAGVPIRLMIRGICCLRPEVPGLSDTIEVRSIVDDLLEHSRFWIFQNNGDRRVYGSSADWMPRNINRRVELAFPIVDVSCRQRIDRIVDILWADNQHARFGNADGTYRYPVMSEEEGEPRRAQKELMREATEWSERI